VYEVKTLEERRSKLMATAKKGGAKKAAAKGGAKKAAAKKGAKKK
jgi:hypothetical protein